MVIFQKWIVALAISIPLCIGLSQWVYGQNEPFSALPNGEYYYLGPPSSELFDSPYIVLHKWGRIVIGIDARSPHQLICFKGFVEENRIIDTTTVLPPYTPDAQWDYQPGEMLSLSQYTRVAYTSTEADREILETCIEVFAR